MEPRLDFNLNINENFNIIPCIVNPAVSFVGLWLCIACFSILNKDDFKEKFFKYSKIEAFFMSLNLFITVVQPIVKCKNLGISYSYMAQIYLIYFIKYGRSICEMVAFWANIMAGLSCYYFLNNRRSCIKLKQHSWKLVSCVIFVLSSCLFSYKLFQWNIVSYEDDSNKFTVQKSNFTNSKLNSFMEIFAMTMRDGLGVIFLLILNVLLLFKINQVMRTKIHLLKFNFLKSIRINKVHCDLNKMKTSFYRNNQLMSKIDRTKTKMTLAIFFSCLKCLLGRFPIFLYFILLTLFEKNNYIQNHYYWDFFYYTASLTIYLSYWFSFFLFYFFNNKFKKIVNANICKIFQKNKK
jgi:hypothetical protein